MSFLSKVFSRIEDPIARARKSHQYVDGFNKEVLENPVAQKFLSCHKGCDACCHTQVSVNADEAKLLAKRVIEDDIQIDLQKLYIQGDAENCGKSWFEIPYELRGCVFLDAGGECRVYEDRPSVCRTNAAFSDPKMCETRDGVEKPVRLLNTDKADIVTITSYQASGRAGTLPLMLWYELDRASETSKKRPKKKLKDFDLKKIKKDLFKIFEV